MTAAHKARRHQFTQAGAAGQPANEGRTPVKKRILDTRGQA
jgi:hypothetical protein